MNSPLSTAKYSSKIALRPRKKPGQGSVGGVVQVAPGTTALCPDGALLRIDPDPSHPAEVEDEPIVAGPKAGDAVAAAPHGQQNPVLASELDRCHHVPYPRGADDQRGPAVDHRVVDTACLIIA